MVETLNNTSITHPLGYRMSDTNVYYEEMDRKWRDLIIFFNKCQVFVGMGPKISYCMVKTGPQITFRALQSQEEIS